MSARDRKRRRRRRGRRSSFLGLAAAVLGVCAGIALMSVVGWVMAVAASTPPLGKPVDKGASSVVYAANGARLGYISSDTLRTPVSWNRIPADVKNATVAIEDQRYYKHGGVDYMSILRAAVKNVTTGRTVQGGSTITMQLVRNLYIANPTRNFRRKIREAKLASELEAQHSKQWILTQYLNSAPYGTVGGQSAMGVQAAAQTFFGRNVWQLNLAQAALLAGLPQAPSQYNPFLDPGAAKTRRDEVLGKMAQLGYISKSQASAAIASPLQVKHGTRYTSVREHYFYDYVKQELIDRFGINTVTKGGLKIYTTIDPRLQELARAAIHRNLPTPGDPASAIVSIDPQTGYIRAMASSQKFGKSQFNLAAQGLRQPGSTFKVMVLVAALREGIDPDTTIYNSHPIDIKSSIYGPIKVRTYGNSYSGPINIREATLQSDNSVYIQLDLDVGPKYVESTAHLLGITSKLNGYPGEGLGGLKHGVSPLEMASAYATLAADGVRAKPEAIEKVVFPGGRAQEIGKPKRKRVISDGIAQEATSILHANAQSGTATRAAIGCPIAAKTGTTNDFKDAWLVGYTPLMSTSVWVGYPKAGIPMYNVEGVGAVAGGTIPAGIWHDYMGPAIGKRCRDFPTNPKVPFEAVPFHGKYASEGLRERSQSGPGDENKKTKKKQKNNGRDNGGDNRRNNGGGPKEKPPPAQSPPENGGGTGPPAR